MKVAAGICIVVSAAAELAGVWLLVRQAQAAKAQLAGWESANPARHEKGSYDQLLLLNPVVSRLLRDQANPRWAVGLLVMGVLLGAMGNFLSLS